MQINVYPVRNLACPLCGQTRHEGRKSLGYGHPPPPGVCCQATPDGGTVCSDGFIGPPG
jgi:hypothetical protein